MDAANSVPRRVPTARRRLSGSHGFAKEFVLQALCASTISRKDGIRPKIVARLLLSLLELRGNQRTPPRVLRASHRVGNAVLPIRPANRNSAVVQLPRPATSSRVARGVVGAGRSEPARKQQTVTGRTAGVS